MLLGLHAVRLQMSLRDLKFSPRVIPNEVRDLDSSASPQNDSGSEEKVQ